MGGIQLSCHRCVDDDVQSGGVGKVVSEMFAVLTTPPHGTLSDSGTMVEKSSRPGGEPALSALRAKILESEYIDI